MFQLSKNQDRLSEIREFQELAQTLKPIFDSVDESIQKIASYILNIKFPSYTVDEIKLNANKESLVRVTDQQALIEESYKVSTRNSSSEELNSLMFMVFTACNLQTIYSITCTFLLILCLNHLHKTKKQAIEEKKASLNNQSDDFGKKIAKNREILAKANAFSLIIDINLLFA